MLVTYRGKEIDYSNIKPNDIDIYDIIHSITKINRFIGHSSRAYSVGEHTIWGLQMANQLGFTPRLSLLFFIHDFTEAYVGDCPSPLKRLLPLFSEIEERVEVAILNHLGLEPPTEEEYKLVKRIDMTMLVIEMRDLTLHNYENFIDEHTYLEILDDPYFNLSKRIIDPDNIQTLMIELFDTLMKANKKVWEGRK